MKALVKSTCPKFPVIIEEPQMDQTQGQGPAADTSSSRFSGPSHRLEAD